MRRKPFSWNWSPTSPPLCPWCEFRRPTCLCSHMSVFSESLSHAKSWWPALSLLPTKIHKPLRSPCWCRWAAGPLIHHSGSYLKSSVLFLLVFQIFLEGSLLILLSSPMVPQPTQVSNATSLYIKFLFYALPIFCFSRRSLVWNLRTIRTDMMRKHSYLIQLLQVILSSFRVK